MCCLTCSVSLFSTLKARSFIFIPCDAVIINLGTSFNEQLQEMLIKGQGAAHWSLLMFCISEGLGCLIIIVSSLITKDPNTLSSLLLQV